MSPEQAIRVKRLPHGGELSLPRRMTADASGCDIAAAVDSPLVLGPGQRAVVPTGLVFEIPRGYEVQVRPRSGLAAKQGVTVLNTPGTIDADYRGEVKVILINLGTEPHTVNRGDRIAQVVPARVATEIDFAEHQELSETSRGDGGFGHTGL
ncbi:MAG: dUTP diphosphatase [Chitinivibrionales bacterium]|nr:dUTP diphosphatase [Chitinivibrionales bacterium]MBD3395499.1 dUTP diphosphatase [Chitinivibrionales bacterium]